MNRRTFIDDLAISYSSQYADWEGDSVVIFPSKRGGMIFLKKLAEMGIGNEELPSVLSIDEFFQEISPFSQIDSLVSLFHLYPQFKEAFPEENIDYFFTVGPDIIKDFDEVDRYLEEPESLFVNISDLRKIDVQIDSWHDKPTEFQQKYIQFWDKLRELYGAFKKDLIEKGLAYPGMNIRHISQNITQIQEKFEWKRLIFAGFNGLSPTEIDVFKKLQSLMEVKFYWDFDAHYTSTPDHEAGFFYRLNKKNGLIPSSYSPPKHLENGQLKIHEVSGSGLTVQAKFIGIHLLELIKRGVTPDKIAIVLPDEGFLYPVINSLPPEIKDINISMGLNMVSTPLHSLIESIFELFDPKKGGIKREYFYFQQVLGILSHPFILKIEAKNSNSLIREIHEQNIIYVDKKRFESLNEDSIIKHLFTGRSKQKEETAFLLDLLQLFMKDFRELENTSENKMIKEIVFSFHTLIQKIQFQFSGSEIKLTLKTFRKIYREQVRKTKIPFTGEPVKGLQILGILETRTIDYDYLIIPSCNEGTLPPTKSSPGSIPFSVRKIFGLPVKEEKTAILAYHFYRLIQRAKEAVFIYNSDLSGGEKSRFLMQLDKELPASLEPIKRESFGFPIKPNIAQPVSVEKTKDVLTHIERFLEVNGFSPTSFNVFLQCQLKFYFNYILKLREATEATESIEHNTFGLIAHKSLEVLYEDYINEELADEHYKMMLSRVESVVEKAFYEETHGQQSKTGKNYLLKKVIITQIKKLLQIEKGIPKTVVKQLETKHSKDIKLGKLVVKFGGVVDRIDFSEGKTRIIDYKTGNVLRVKKLDFSEINIASAGVKESIQLYIYSWLISTEDQKDLQPGIYSLRNLGSGLKKIPGGLTSEDNKALEDFIIEKTYELLNPENSIHQTVEIKHCTYCPYKTICNR